MIHVRRCTPIPALLFTVSLTSPLAAIWPCCVGKRLQSLLFLTFIYLFTYLFLVGLHPDDAVHQRHLHPHQLRGFHQLPVLWGHCCWADCSPCQKAQHASTYQGADYNTSAPLEPFINLTSLKSPELRKTHSTNAEKIICPSLSSVNFSEMLFLFPSKHYWRSNKAPFLTEGCRKRANYAVLCSFLG